MALDLPPRPGADYATERFGLAFSLLGAVSVLAAFADDLPFVRV